jgi:hypothetical protein
MAERISDSRLAELVELAIDRLSFKSDKRVQEVAMVMALRELQERRAGHNSPPVQRTAPGQEHPQRKMIDKLRTLADRFERDPWLQLATISEDPAERVQELILLVESENGRSVLAEGAILAALHDLERRIK